MTDPHVGVVLVTHNSVRWIDETLDSIQAQKMQPHRIVVIDDYSTDATSSILDSWTEKLRDAGIDVTVSSATSMSDDPVTRIAQNFCQGVRACSSLDFVALGDHDDTWLPDRLNEQVASMRADPSILMLANDGLVEATSTTLFDSFGVPGNLEVGDPVYLFRHVIRHSIATGGASMVRPQRLIESGALVPPAGWLHDRWWSLVAASRGALRLSATPVIRYRISRTQVIGLDRGRQTEGGPSRWRSVTPADLRRFVSLHALRKTAAPELQSELQWGRLMKNLL